MAKLLKYNQIFEELIEKDIENDDKTQKFSKDQEERRSPNDSEKESNDSKFRGSGTINPTLFTNSTAINSENKPVRIKLKPRLVEILEILEDEDDFVAYEILWLGDDKSVYHNGIRIEDVDISDVASCFEVIICDKKTDMKIDKFVKYYFSSKYLKPEDVDNFIKSYNLLVGTEEIPDDKIKAPVRYSKDSNIRVKVDLGDKITIEPFVYSPDDVRRTFLSLVTKTYPNGTEYKLLPFLPKLKKDNFNNYYIIIGDENPKTMFTSHLDTAGRIESNVSLYSKKDQNNDEIIGTDGNTILGADDKSGVSIMLYMIDKKVPGLYYFFIGEEVGGIGSGNVARNYKTIEYLNKIERCVSFDRRGVKSVITKQLGRVCCSNAFADGLCEEYNKQGFNLYPDPTGIYTDSASFIDYIPECTNISVGYYNEHSSSEIQNIDYLIRLAKASVNVNWDSLPTNRKIGIDDHILRKYSGLIYDIKDYPFSIDVKIVTEDNGDVFIRCDLEDGLISETYESLNVLKYLLQRHNVRQTVYFDEEYIKIKLAK